MSEAAARGLRRERRKRRTREALLTSARSLFAERGVHATRLEDITEAADLGKGAFYNYFPSKESLVGELLREALRDLDGRYLSRVDAAAPLAERTRGLVREHVRFFREHPDRMLLFHQARGLLALPQRRDSALTAVFVEYLKRVGELLAGQDVEQRWSQALRDDLAAALAGAIAGYLSFQTATGLGSDAGVIEALLGAGVPQAVLSLVGEALV